MFPAAGVRYQGVLLLGELSVDQSDPTTEPGVGPRRHYLHLVPRWNPHVTGFIVAVALANVVLYHGPLFSFAAANLNFSTIGGAETLATLFFLAALATAFVFSCLSLISQRLIKPLCMLGALGNALAMYFVQSYGVVLDKTMVGNVLNTHFAEASSFLHPKLLLYLLLLGALPCWVLSTVQIQATSLRRRAVLFVAVLLIGVAWIYAASTTWPWIDQNSRTLGGLTMPWSYVIGASRLYADHLSTTREQTLLPAARFLTHQKTIVVLVIGESARAEDFSLYGYRRNTNPLLAQSDVVALAHSRACATYTTASLLCIVSPFDSGWPLSSSYEPLPSYLQRHGIDVIWRTNNWGEPPLKVQTYQRTEEIPGACQGNACRYDEALLQGLEQRIRSSPKDKIFIVLHQHGSHGPSYSTEYPPQFEVFRPVCRSVDLHQCTHAELLNAYDNTIVYADDFLHRTIDLLKTFSPTATLLMYVSDHGESLGEYGLYLHGTPYPIAPDVQKDIPILVWMSAEFKRDKGIAMTQLNSESSHSQANVFHSVMGAFDMRSDIYNRQLDLFGGETK
jgi:lipid A ethanolaminephosphotransferase